MQRFPLTHQAREKTVAKIEGLGPTVLAPIAAAFLRAIRFVFTPVLDGLRRKHVAVLAGIGALVAAIGARLIYYRH